MESKLEGGIEGAVETCKKFNIPLQQTIQHIADRFSLSLQRIEEEVKKYWQQ